MLVSKTINHSNFFWDNSFWTGKYSGIRPAAKSPETQTSCRNEKDAQRDLEKGTPNISPRSFFSTYLVTKTFFLQIPCQVPT